ncbi:unnamed protein product, partial [Didymodactylos carnosus]
MSTSLVILQILITRILANGFQLDYAIKSESWCKLRAYFVIMAALISLTMETFSTIDRYFSTCREVKMRNLSSMRTAKFLAACSVPICLVINVPTLIYYDIYLLGGQPVCLSVNAIYNSYISYIYSPILIGMLPFSLMILFGLLTCRNIQIIGRRRTDASVITSVTGGGVIGGGSSVQSVSSRRMDAQLTSMFLMNIIVVSTAVFPYSAYNIYSAITLNFQKDSDRRAIEGFIAQTVLLL